MPMQRTVDGIFGSNLLVIMFTLQFAAEKPATTPDWMGASHGRYGC